MSHVSDLRPSPIAGMWYSGNPDRLEREVDNYLAQAQIPDLKGEVVAVIAPHAGYRYSGRTAGHAFRALKGRSFELVAVISPSHTYYSEPLLTTAHQGYATPLGPLWVDQQALRQLAENLAQDEQAIHQIAHDREHSLEIELPFLQRALATEFKLLPIMISGKEHTMVEALGHALAKTLRGRSAVLVASTDLSHFYPEPVADKLDAEMLRQISAFSPEGVLRVDDAGTGLACGAAAVAAVLWAARDLGADSVEILHHSTSGDETGDTTSVVGYGAAAVLKRA